jgi:hypothetical protein
MSMSGAASMMLPTLFEMIEIARNPDLAECLDRDPIAHGMGEYTHFFGVAGEQEAQRVFEPVARHGRAVEIIDISGRFSARRPGEQHRNAGGFRIMGELRRAVDRLGEHRIEAMNEQKNVAAAGRPARQLGVQRLDERLVAVEIFFVAHDEVLVRIAGGRGRPFDLALPMGRRDRDRQLCVVNGACPIAVEQRARPVVPFSGRRDKQGMVDSAGGTQGDRAQKTALRPRGAADE